MLTFEQIKELIDIVCERKLESVEIERSGFRLRIDGRSRVRPVAAPTVNGVAVAGSSADEEQGQEALADEAEAADQAAPGAAVPEGGHVLNSPIVGTFYTSPSPGADPYVQVGDQVKKGQVLCIVEAMKLMNEIESDVDGEVVEIYPKNAQPVEYGESLFALRLA